MSYSVGDIKVAAYRWEQLPDMTTAERELWLGLGYCYEWYRSHPDEKNECDNLAQLYLRMFELRTGRMLQKDDNRLREPHGIQDGGRAGHGGK